MSEKPLARSSLESNELARLAEACHFPMVRQAREMLLNDRLGKVHLVTGGYLQDWLLFDTDYSWRLDKEKNGHSRAVADIGSHWCDTIQYVLGKKIIEVFADVKTIHPIRKRPKRAVPTFTDGYNEEYDEIEVDTEDCGSIFVHFEDDNTFGPRKKGIGKWGKPNWDGIYDVEVLATALIRMEDGSTLSLDVSWAANVDTDNLPLIQLLGTEGGACFRGAQGKLFTEKFDRPIDIELREPDQDEGDRNRFSRHFLECIREGKEPICSAMSGYTNNLILDAIYESSRTGNEVKIKWDL
ncbi:Gfo/Idh/MocA family protein [Paenibacillus sp. GCM10027628]|uniref:Gfo/Idh/MocA family protein n=1 Tax=Paenibacillus sp. GCM10027628 TaxID=3273413 RepID=UPI0036436D39